MIRSLYLKLFEAIQTRKEKSLRNHPGNKYAHFITYDNLIGILNEFYLKELKERKEVTSEPKVEIIDKKYLLSLLEEANTLGYQTYIDQKDRKTDKSCSNVFKDWLKIKQLT